MTTQTNTWLAAGLLVAAFIAAHLATAAASPGRYQTFSPGTILDTRTGALYTLSDPIVVTDPTHAPRYWRPLTNDVGLEPPPETHFPIR